MLIEHFAFIIAAVLLLVGEVLGVLSFRQVKNSLRTRLFLIGGAEVWLWLLFNLLELLAASERWTIVFMKFSFIPLIMLPPTLIWLAYAFIGGERKQFVKLLFIPFLFFVGAMLTNGWHHLFWESYQFTQYGAVLGIRTTYGIFFYLNALCSYSVFIFGVGILLANLVNIAEKYRKKAVLSIAALALTILWNIAYVMRIIPFQKDFSPVIYNAVFSVLIYAAIHHNLFTTFILPRQRIFNHIKDGVIVFDENIIILDINSSAKLMLGIDDSCIGQSLETQLPFWPDLRPSGLLPQENRSESESAVVMIGESPGLQYLNVSIRSLGQGYLLLLHDVTEVQQLMIQIEEMANFDTLTQLRNRRSFFNMVESLIASAKRNRQPISIMLLDIDNFKDVNETFGHAVGDLVLKQIAGFLTATLRGVDVKARYGGDEFILLLPQTNLESAKIVADRLYRGFSTITEELGIPSLSVTVSIGISGREILERAQSLMEIVEEADRALSVVKNQGKGFALNYFEIE